MSLRKYFILRCLLLVPNIVLLATIIFLILHVLPGDPVEVVVGPRTPEVIKNAMRHQLGLDAPLPTQYVSYIVGIFTGHLGNSLVTGIPVVSELQAFFPATLELTLSATVVALLLGIPLGVFSSTHADSKMDLGSRAFGIIIYTVPVFWLGLMLQLAFGVYVKILPVGGMGATPSRIYTGMYVLDSILSGDFRSFSSDVLSLVLPSLSLGLILAGAFSRLTRAYMIESLSSDYTTAAKARGLRNRTIVVSYGLKNALIPLITIIGLQIALLLGGAVLTETTFSWPGVGLYLVQRIARRDYNAVQGAIVLFAVLIAVTSTIVDMLYALIDPRVRL